jgi:hypothetical protein
VRRAKAMLALCSWSSHTTPGKAQPFSANAASRRGRRLDRAARRRVLHGLGVLPLLVRLRAASPGGGRQFSVGELGGACRRFWLRSPCRVHAVAAHPLSCMRLAHASLRSRAGTACGWSPSRSPGCRPSCEHDHITEAAIQLAFRLRSSRNVPTWWGEPTMIGAKSPCLRFMVTPPCC